MNSIITNSNGELNQIREKIAQFNLSKINVNINQLPSPTNKQTAVVTVDMGGEKIQCQGIGVASGCSMNTDDAGMIIGSALSSAIAMNTDFIDMMNHNTDMQPAQNRNEKSNENNQIQEKKEFNYRPDKPMSSKQLDLICRMMDRKGITESVEKYIKKRLNKKIEYMTNEDANIIIQELKF